jgi:hypothetical protein
MDVSSSSSVPPGEPLRGPVALDPEFWSQLRETLMSADGEHPVAPLEPAQADLVIALLQMSNQQGFFTGEAQIIAIADTLKLISINENISVSNAAAEIKARIEQISESINLPIQNISLTEQNVRKCRIFITCLFGAGISIAAINAIVPIPFGLMAKTVFSLGINAARTFFGTILSTVSDVSQGPMTPDQIAAAAEAAARAAAAAEAEAPFNMVAGPSIDAIRAVGSAIYSLSALVLTKCVSVASGAVAAVCNKASAEAVADLAVEATALQVAVVSYDYVKKLYNGEYDAAIAAIIDNGPIDVMTNNIINAILESAYDIDAAKIGVVLRTPKRNLQSIAIDPTVVPPDRQLDVHIKRIIDGNFYQFIEDIEPFIKRSDGLTSSILAIMLELSSLDEEDPNPVVVNQLIRNYGMPLVMMYMLKYNNAPKSKLGMGENKNSSSLPPEASEPEFRLTKRSRSAPGRFVRPSFPESFLVATPNIPAKIPLKLLEEAGYGESKPLFREYIVELMGKMDERVRQILLEPRTLDTYADGNLYTAIEKNNLSVFKQQEIVEYIIKNFRPMTGQNEEIDQALFQRIAATVRQMILAGNMNLPPQEAATTISKFTSNASKPSIKPPSSLAARRRVKESTEALGTNPIYKKEKKGGRKSRRHKKKRSTLKRRRMKRRMTRKGKKRRHTKKRR